ncbi:DUF6511 domain-containing protein [Bradyrhizobium retamae]|uniref:Uncharacterized protein n=1 Tax=Bradyrhizobium retamae TaxID=1300035 RepID=A0A0R3MUJ9_9BRAD|nr:DUF6511 domain-containing protein [Bradyrhizobium retamae]KRR21669.1 hypothetical protein CQ13_06360 [Bradyrhizobium retamae]
MTRRNFDAEPVCCGVCQRQAVGLGYAPKQGTPVLWLCDEPECIQLGRVVFHMAPSKLTHFERLSLADAGSEGGAYLEKLGKFDLSELSQDEWMNFLTIVLKGYGTKMREHVLSHAAPF